MMLAIRVSEEIEKRLQNLADKTGRTKPIMLVRPLSTF